MATLTRSQQARINGARSRGPVTAEDKARSARNATKHGQYAKPTACAHSVLLKNEDLPVFEELVERRTQHLRPVNSFEASLVREIAALEWKYDRLAAVETRHIDLQIAQETEALRRQAGSLRGVTSLDVTAFGIGTLVEITRILPFCAIELTRLQRARRQVLDTLIAYRKNFRPLNQSEDPIDLQQLDRWNEPSLEDLQASAATAAGPLPGAGERPPIAVAGPTSIDEPAAPIEAAGDPVEAAGNANATPEPQRGPAPTPSVQPGEPPTQAATTACRRPQPPNNAVLDGARQAA